MMQTMRNPKVLKWGLWIILILTIPSFVLFYGFGTDAGSAPGASQTWVTVNPPNGDEIELVNSDIDLAKDELIYSHLLLYLSTTGQQPTTAIRSGIQNSLTNKDYMDYAVSDAAIRLLGEQSNVMVSNEQIEQLLRAQNVTREQLASTLQRERLTEAQYLARLRYNLQDARSEDLIRNIARASLLEMWMEYRLMNDQVSAEYAELPSEQFRETVTVTDEEIQKHFDDNQSQFIRPAQRVYNYVLVAPPPTTEEFQVSGAEALARYDQIDPAIDSRFAQEPGKEIRQIMLTIEEGESIEALVVQLEELKGQLTPDNFSAFADQFTQDLQNLEFTGADSPVKRGGVVSPKLTDESAGELETLYGEEWLRRAATLNEGQISDVFVSNDSVFLMLAGETSEDKIPFEEARPILEAEIRTQQQTEEREARNAYVVEMQERIREVVETRSTIEGIAQALGEDVQATSSTVTAATPRTFIPGIGNLGLNAEAVEDLEEGEISPVVRTASDDLVVVELEREVPEEQRPLAEVRSEIERELRAEKARDEARRMGERIVERVRSGDEFTSVVAELELELQSAENIALQNAPMELRMAQDFAPFAFRGQPGDATVLDSMMGSVYVLQLTGKTEPDRYEFIDQMQNLERALTQAKRDMLLDEFRKDAVDMMNPEYNEAVLNEENQRGRRRSRG